jgi:hypothetical protein
MRSFLVLGFLLVAACGDKATGSGDAGAGGAAPSTGCAAVFPDGGMASDVVCDIGWTCSSGMEHFQLICTAVAGGNESCECLSDQTTLTPTIVVNSFICQGTTALAVINACGNFNLQM